MKKFSILIIALLIAPMMLSAFNKELAKSLNPNTAPNVPQLIQFGNQDRIVSSSALEKISNPGILANYKPIDTILDASLSIFDMVKPVVYEPKSNSLIIASTWRARMQQSDQVLTGQTYCYISTNMGTSWGTKMLHEELGILPVWQNIAVVNTDGSTNPDDLHYFLTGPYYKYSQATSNYQMNYGHYIVSSPVVNMNFTMAGPEANNPGYTWWTSYIASTDGLGFPMYFHGNILNSGESLQYGPYGITSFFIDLDTKDANYQYSGIPSNLGTSNFRPSPAINSSYNDKGYPGADKNGNLYFCVDNMFADNPDRRVPAVMKSNDMGTTWSAWNRMPASLLENYVADNGGSTVLPFYIASYNVQDFIVIDEDNYSFFARVVFQKNEDEITSHLVEINYNGSQWKIYAIAEIVGSNFWGSNHWFIIHKTSAYDNAEKEFIIQSPYENEINAAITADGKSLLVKWLDYNGNRIPVTPTATLYQDIKDANNVPQPDREWNFDSLDVNDIYFAYRNINGTWSERKNLTNDNMVNNLTFIPHVIPSLNEVPLISYNTVKANDPSSIRYNYPYETITQMCIDMHETSQGFMASLGVTYMVFDAVNFNSVEENTNTSLSIDQMYPNPAMETINLPLNLNNSGSVRVEVFTTLGVKVANVLNSTLSAGSHVIPFSTANLSSGIYLCKVTVDGHVTSQTFVVQR